MPKQLIIDGKPIEVEDGTTLLQACEQAGAEIPRFCYHERLSIAGNCRMCLVEVQGIAEADRVVRHGRQRPAAQPDGSLENRHTNNAAGQEGARRGDGISADQSPARLPDLRPGRRVRSAGPGDGLSAWAARAIAENKRAVEEKYIGPLIKTFMNRCIHCTRCVRFMTEVAGVEELGAIGRGEDMEITTYLDRGIISELSANVNDLCPVGALTHRPWAFIARPWELEQDRNHRRHGRARLGDPRRHARARSHAHPAAQSTTT